MPAQELPAPEERAGAQGLSGQSEAMNRRCAALLLAMAVPAALADEAQPSLGQDIKSGATAVGHGVRDGATAIGHGFRDGAKVVGHGFRDGSRAAGHTIKRGAQATGHAIHKGASETGHAISDTAHKATGK